MLSQDFKATYQEAPKFDPLPPDTYQVELYDITARQVENYNWKKGERVDKFGYPVPQFDNIFNFQWGLLEGEQNGKSLRGFSIWNDYIPTMLYIGKKNGKNKLFKIVEALIGRELNQTEVVAGLDGSFLNSLVGKQCRILVEHVEKNDKVFANPVNWLKAKGELPMLNTEERNKIKEFNEKRKAKGESVTNEITVDQIPF